MWVCQNKLHIVRAIHSRTVPEVEQCLLVLVDRNAGFRQLRVEQLPQILEEWTKEKLFMLGEE